VSPISLLDKYPLGYVVFGIDRENSLFPYATKSAFDSWDIDWQKSEARLTKNPSNG